MARNLAATSFCGWPRSFRYSPTLATSRALRSLPCMLPSFPEILSKENGATVLVQEDRGEAPRVAVGLTEETHAPPPQLFVGRMDVVDAQRQDRDAVGATDPRLLVVALGLLHNDPGPSAHGRERDPSRAFAIRLVLDLFQ